MRYSTIYHNIRNAAGLSLVDYCLLDAIYMLSTSNLERYKGWCNASKSSFDHITSVRNITKRYNVLEANGWLEFKGENRYLKRTTEKYYREIRVHIDRMNKVPTNKEQSTPLKELHPPMNKVHPPHEQSTCLEVNKVHPPHEQSTPNNNIDNKRDNNIDKERKGKDKLSPVSSKELSQEEYLEILEKAAATVGAKNQPSEKEKKLRKKKKKQEDEKLEKAFEVLDFFKEVTGKKLMYAKTRADQLKSSKVKDVFRALDHGHTVEQCKGIIFIKNEAWKGEEKTREWIRTGTLFRKIHLEQYLDDLINSPFADVDWSNWEQETKIIKQQQHEQRINNRQGQQQGGNNLPDYSIYSQPIDIDD